MAPHETWLRVVIYKVDEHAYHLNQGNHLAALAAYEAALAFMKDSVQDFVHELEQHPGFQVGYWGHNPTEATISAVTYWSSLEAIERAGGGLAWLQEQAKPYRLYVVSVHHTRLFAVPATHMWALDDDQDDNGVTETEHKYRMLPHLPRLPHLLHH